MYKFPGKTISRSAVNLAAAVCALAGVGSTAPALAAGACSDPSLNSLTAYVLGTHNTIAAMRLGSPGQATQVTGIDGNLIGIDFRPSDPNNGSFYGISDTGAVYLINPSLTPYRASLVSNVAPRFAGGYQSLADFNPTGTQNALRLIGSNDQNYALTGATLNQTVVQTALRYAAGDANANVDPNITAGAYDTNIAPAATTTFFMIDYDLDTLVTIADRNAAGSSNTGGGQLKTVGPIVDEQGKPINFAPTAGLDIYTSALGANLAFAASGQDLYCIDLAGVNANLPVGTQQKVLAQRVLTASQEIARLARGGAIDIAVNPFSAAVVVNQADLEVTANAFPDGVRSGSRVFFTATVRNLGPASADAVALSSAVLPFSNLPRPVTVSTTQGTCTLSGALRQLVGCDLGALASGASATVSVAGFYNGSPGTIGTTFTAFSPTLDANRANNSASAQVTIIEEPSPIDLPLLR